MDKKTKKFWESKTFWINALAIAGGITTGLSGELATGVSLTGAGLVNMVLRVISKHEIKV